METLFLSLNLMKEYLKKKSQMQQNLLLKKILLRLVFLLLRKSQHSIQKQ